MTGDEVGDEGGKAVFVFSVLTVFLVFSVFVLFLVFSAFVVFLGFSVFVLFLGFKDGGVAEERGMVIKYQ